MSKRTKKSKQIEAAAVEAVTVEQTTTTEQGAPEASTGKKFRAMSKTLAHYRQAYEDKTRCGDDLSHRLMGMSPEAVVEMAERLLGLNAGEWAEKYAGLNRGQKRMNAGNRIRAAIKAGKLAIEAVK